MMHSVRSLAQFWFVEGRITATLLRKSNEGCLTQKRMRRRTLTPPPWLPKKKEEKIVESIDPNTQVMLQKLIKLENEGACQNLIHVPIIRANPHLSPKAPLCELPQAVPSPEWTPESNRIGMIARKIGMFPQWTVDGTRFLCTLLEFPKNVVISAVDPETYYRISIVGKRKAYGRYGPRWRIMIGAEDGDPSKYSAQYRAAFERHGISVKKHIAAFLVTEDAVVRPGTELHICHFKVGQFITATGHTIDWGFQGGMHRWGFKGMPARRTTKSHRRIGAIGSKGDARVRPGKRMPGHMGYEWRSIPGLEVLRINPEKQVMYVNGSVPGETGEILLIKDCYHDKKKVLNPHFPTFYFEKDFEAETKCNENPDSLFVYEDGEFFARRLFRMTMPSIVFTEPEEFKGIKRDKTKAKTAKVLFFESSLLHTGVHQYLCVSSIIFNMNGENLLATDEVSAKKDHSVNKLSHCLRAISAARLPRIVLLSVFEYLSLRDLAQCSRVCKHWWIVLQHPDSFVWERLAHLIIPEEALNDPYLLSETPSLKDKIRAFYYAWNPEDLSANNYLRTNGFTVHRNPVAQSTDGVRGKIGVNGGIHAWEFKWEGPLGTVACIGLATKHAALHCQGYVALLGSDDQSWGWNLVDNNLMHNGLPISHYPYINNPPKYQVSNSRRSCWNFG
ncbi:unnamed protein product [Thelazia callipaeda]|uniref:Large ribosomal subunit protein uL3m n=1 Tax=Thelazia callipaeda TaxID=103827 RepID=A0A0N5DA34_THECL|nr:unnamed protein product [Thelazia callipaeda]